MSLARPLIAYMPLFVVTLLYRDSDLELARLSRFFVWFSLVSVLGSQGFGGYLYALNIASNGKPGFQSLKLLVRLRRGLFGWWTLLVFVQAFLLLTVFVGCPVSFESIFVSAASALTGPVILVSTQYLISSGRLLQSIWMTMLQAIFLLASILCIIHAGAGGLPSALSALLLAILSFFSLYKISRISPFKDASLWALKPFSRSFKVDASARLKCFFDGFLPPIYTASIISFFSSSKQFGVSADFQFAFYSYSRISDALISCLVVFGTYLLANNRRPLRSSSSAAFSGSLAASPNEITGSASWFRVLVLLAGISTIAFALGYVYNCFFTGVCLAPVIAFDLALSMGKLFAIFASFLLVVTLPRFSLFLQVVGLSVSLVLMLSPLRVELYMAIYVLCFWLLQLVLPTLYLWRGRLS